MSGQARLFIAINIPVSQWLRTTSFISHQTLHAPCRSAGGCALCSFTQGSRPSGVWLISTAEGEDRVVNCILALKVYTWKRHRTKQVTWLHPTSKSEEVHSYHVFGKAGHTWWAQLSQLMIIAMKKKARWRRWCLGRWFLLDIDGQEWSVW